MDNPPVLPAELRTVTIIGLYRNGSPAIPKWVTNDTWQKTGTDFLIGCPEWITGGVYHQMRAFAKRVGHEFLLTATDHPTVRAHLNGWNLSQGDGQFQAYGAQAAPEDRAKLAPGGAYRLQPINISDTYRWVVAPETKSLTFDE